jgi:hypothetical protein
MTHHTNPTASGTPSVDHTEAGARCADGRPRHVKRKPWTEGKLAFIPLTKGHIAILDADLLPLVSGFNWRANEAKNTVYACRKGRAGEAKAVLMHRVLLQAPPGLMVDHSDGNGLNNTVCNLRLATPAQNQHNQGIASHNSSGFKGVHFCKTRQVWVAGIRFKGKKRTLGRFVSVEDAAAAYAAAAETLFGEFARLK